MVKGRRRRWPWIVLGCVAIVAALLLIAQDQETVRVRSPLDARDPQFTAYVASLVGVPVSDGNAYQMLLNGDAIFPAMLQAIAKAEHRISFESFIYSGGEVARQFTSALTAAARRGVTVRIVLDSIGSMDLPKETVKGAHRRRHSGGLVQSAGIRGQSRRSITARTARCSSWTASSPSPAASASPITGVGTPE
jgi:phosphatidylserine/phosphatidylglycerophosphate/cardiolipin synthase-like enzyme